MIIKVLGACCKKSLETFENTKEAVEKLNIDAEVINIGDNMEIMKYGVMSTPAIVIDEKVVCFGKFLKTKEVIDILTKAIKESPNEQK